MPTLALPPQPPYAMVASPNERRVSESQGHGVEAHQLNTLFDEAINHWLQPAAMFFLVLEQVDEYSYEPVPPNRVFYVSTRYVYGGKGEPQPFELEDE